ncbi:hypothetical protein ECC02_001509 [Trypanosoma cruzi]|uniref:Cytidyltransferase-like domain-containing protein n=1 Tax=Trypanosoma cruzi TaxID=5693 RepID=A0A7J6YF09_TRYCR|nr:hypothetical protein ECC02_001509 [Trypanosoma cruzi]
MSDDTAASYRLSGLKLTPWSAIDVMVVRRLALVAMCGSFNPIHLAHIAMYDAARDALMHHTEATDAPSNVVVVGGFFSPVNDHYGKEGLRPFAQRAAICKAALADHPSLAVDEWEGLQPMYVRTVHVLDHLQKAAQRWYETDAAPNATQLAWVRQHPLSVVFVCGSDLFASFLRPGCWSLKLLKQLLDNFDVMVVRRACTNVGCEDMLRRHGSFLRENVKDTENDCTRLLTLDLAAYRFMEVEIFANETSSSAVREALAADHAADISNLVPAGADSLIRAFYANNTQNY